MQTKCPVCERSWTVGVERLRTAVYCSGRCRVRACRQRKAARDSTTDTLVVEHPTETLNTP
ncbi:hypothetical protein [Streptomyces sp. NPDC051572]|uniref:hypothetical protein n=1 Tax=Streptomyces sp. NPDC051572 TaxID=3155802 RepID=UPI00344ED93F